MKMNKNMGLTGLALLLALGIGTGCAGPKSRIQDVNSATRDMVLSQTAYNQEMTTSAACETSKVDDYKGLTGGVKKYFKSLVDSGAKVCDITKGYSANEYNEGLKTVMELVYANDRLDCGVNAFDKGVVLSQNEPMALKYEAITELVKKNGPYMPALATQVRSCVAKRGINNNLYIANSADRTSALLWAIGLASKSGSDGGQQSSNPTVGSGSNTTIIGDVTTGGL